MLPSPPRWKYQVVLTEFPTTKTLCIFYRDAIECLQSLLSHPLLADSFDFIPRKFYESAEHAVCIYYGFMTGNRAWELQTKVSSLSSNHYAHLLLISLANIDSEIRGKGSLEAYIPLALFPIAKFIHRNQRMRGVLADWLLHQCIGIVIEPLKQAAHLGILMSDPAGFSRYCCMPLVVYVADTPKELVIACITMNASPVTMSTSGTRLDIHFAFFEECKQYFLNSVLTPFWLDWLTADPSSFLMPELLHHLLKMFWDHDC
ncbi:hypothetical protein F4604DRAFT_1919614 [Suillus subluteus]|nr:hypothetical protein F4604DRAFT_1919614 [Suillus subluteus]